MPGAPSEISARGRAAVRIPDEQRLDWLRLIRSDHVGPRTFRVLLKHYGSAGAALAALPDLARRGGANHPPRVHSRRDAERELAAAASLGATLVALGKSDYPPRLEMIDDAPPCSPSRWWQSSAPATPRPRGCASPSGSRAISPVPAS
jgi:DNA processing protein